jgi:hypothetical protein
MASPDPADAPHRPCTADIAHRWAARTCASQGLPLKVTTETVLALVVIQLAAGKSVLPGGGGSVGVEAAAGGIC